MFPPSTLSSHETILEAEPPGLGHHDKAFSAFGCISRDGGSCPGLVPCNTNTDPSASRNVLTPSIDSAGGACHLVSITTQDLLAEASICLGDVSDPRVSKDHLSKPISSEPSTTRNPGADLQEEDDSYGRHGLRRVGSQVEEQIRGHDASSLQRRQARLSLSLRLPDPTPADSLRHAQLATTMLVSPHVVTQLQQQLSPFKLSTPLRTPKAEGGISWIPNPDTGKVRLRPVAATDTLSPISPLPSPVHLHSAEVHLGWEAAAIQQDANNGGGCEVEHQLTISMLNPGGVVRKAFEEDTERPSSLSSR
ncbi:hypothetical protein EWM64_g1271 [Hericium alpestre]|uniref:Uncharacterized protein n=1 Tax=Hericium alpestre TaxID=135208 RepID=A0A4Z0A8Z5_9AGAM|nr:hypothetical protein EWM64_g1271 [Hericium alpestre]